MIKLFCFLIWMAFQDIIPYKPSDEFELKLDYKFKDKLISREKIDMRDTRQERYSSGPLPYLEIDIKLLKIKEVESRVSVQTNRGERVMNRRTEQDMIIKLKPGYLADVKDGLTANEYTISFLSADKKEQSRIVISIDRNGDFFVNEEKRGRF